MALAYNLGVGLARLCLSAFARWEVDGRPAVPPHGPLLVVANHLSNADPMVIAASVPRRARFLAKKELFRRPLAPLFRAWGMHPLDRGGGDAGATRWALRALEREQALVVFPEGTRSRGGGMGKAQSGIAYLALRSQASLLPIGITGTEKIPGIWRVAFPLCPIRVTIGQPFTLPPVEGRLDRGVLEAMTEVIMLHIAALLPPTYQGVYAAVSRTPASVSPPPLPEVES